MNFKEYLDGAWGDHSANPEEVCRSLDGAALTVENSGNVIQLAQLSTHIMGEHLSLWKEGVTFLENLKLNNFCNGEAASYIEWSKASLKLSSGLETNLEGYGLSEQIKILSVSAQAMCVQKNTEASKVFFMRALELAASGLEKKDTANRVLAITANNLACELEKVTPRSIPETVLMIMAAQAARQYWEIAGTWLEVERAEYRLAMTYLRADKLDEALSSARNCVRISDENGTEALEMFFGYEALSLVEKAKGNESGYIDACELLLLSFDNLSESDKSWCGVILKSVMG